MKKDKDSDHTFKKNKLVTRNLGTYRGKVEDTVEMMRLRRIDVVRMSEMRVEGEECWIFLGGGYVLAYRG